ncbi:MAG: ABC transporter substrate-binding protein [Candidatus Omnitrophota bacterium]|nr:ABC transporter substrate-binding protein [Candidatus Omnitrophota bacterium]
MRKIKMMAISIILISINLLYNPKVYSEELEKVKVYYQPIISRAPFIIAYEEGYFKEEGLDLELLKFRNSSEAMIMLLQGSIDVLPGAVTAGSFNAVKEGRNLKIVYQLLTHVKGNKYLGFYIKTSLKPNADIKAVIKTLKGKKIGVDSMGTAFHFEIENILKKYRLPLSDVELVVTPISTLTAALASGAINAAILFEPLASIAQAEIQLFPLYYKDEVNDIPLGACLWYGPNLIEKRPETGIKFMRAFLKGIRQYNQGKTKRNIEILNKYIGLEEELLNKINWPVFASSENNINFEALEIYQDWLIEKRYLNERLDINTLIDMSFLEKAKIN